MAITVNAIYPTTRSISVSREVETLLAELGNVNELLRVAGLNANEQAEMQVALMRQTRTAHTEMQAIKKRSRRERVEQTALRVSLAGRVDDLQGDLVVANEQLLTAGVKAKAQAEMQITLKGQADSLREGLRAINEQLLTAGLKVNAQAKVQITEGHADDLREINGALLVASLKADAKTEIQITLKHQAETALIARDEFISIAAHELRSPVTGIKLNAQMARRDLNGASPDTQRIDRYLLDIDVGVNRLVTLVSDLMDVSRMRSGEFLLGVTPIDLAAHVRTVVLRYTNTGSERHHVTLDVPAAPLVVAGDAGRLEQILDNLLSNAIKYSPDGGEIGVRLQEANGGVVLTVRDTGIGLTPGAQEHIFEPFGRAANAKRHGLPGMGLGLHICRQIAEAHGGRMWAESGGEGQGMTIGMWLPSA